MAWKEYEPYLGLGIVGAIIVAAAGAWYLLTMAPGGHTGLYSSVSGTVAVEFLQAGVPTPLAGATVTIGPYVATTDGTGVATFPSVAAPGNYPFTVAAQGFVSYSANLDVSGEAPTFDVPPGAIVLALG